MSQVRKFKVYLEPEQRKRLEAIVHNGHAPAKKILHAQILLMTDQEHPQGRWKDEQIVRALGVHRNTISRIRRRFVEQGEALALNRRVRAEPPSWMGREKPSWWRSAARRPTAVSVGV